MPRRPRVFVEGGLYHLYNRFARGAELFSQPEEIAGREKGRAICRTRYVIAALAIERWGMRAKQLAELLGRWPEAVSRWASRGAEMRMGSGDFRDDYERLDQALANESGSPRRPCSPRTVSSSGRRST